MRPLARSVRIAIQASGIGAIAFLWLAGSALRLTVLAIPPVIALIKSDLNLSATEVGILTGLPIALLAIAAVPGSLLIARFGAESALLSGLFITAIGSALRGALSHVIPLFAATAIMGFGISIVQPALPPLVRKWLPGKVGFGTAVYTNGLLIGEILPVALTPTQMLPLVNGSWRLCLILWSLPVLVIAVLFPVLAPKSFSEPKQHLQWWPDWSNGSLWRFGLIFGSITSMYFTTNAFLPVYLSSAAHSELISGTLAALNLGQLPASFVLLAVGDRLVRRAWPYLFAGITALVSICGLIWSPGIWAIVSSATLGYCCGTILILALALPPLLCAPQDVARTSAGMFTLSYTCAVILPLVSGALWDMTGVPGSAFIPIAFCAIVLIVLAPTIKFHYLDQN
jgi:CP family cyanate transporter-like MFS transporter